MIDASVKGLLIVITICLLVIVGQLMLIQRTLTGENLLRARHDVQQVDIVGIAGYTISSTSPHLPVRVVD